ncbi:hypothetical protein BpHYR1_024570 [Brachionus plicatilis]|uniref:Uncharacterized protein n=1 Tax=Brachionus plicatilis TaxID=10195 RepID=A0A3M7PHF1_BRAPC|nr:hypothetical protein BpHYR1_024570 [Brachionus plicatilis]
MLSFVIILSGRFASLITGIRSSTFSAFSYHVSWFLAIVAHARCLHLCLRTTIIIKRFVVEHHVSLLGVCAAGLSLHLDFHVSSLPTNPRLVKD